MAAPEAGLSLGGCISSTGAKGTMNRREVVGSIVAGAAVAVSVGVAKAADKEIEILVDHWKKSKDLTLKMAQVMPAENYDYKPFPEARSFGGELAHLAQAEGYYLGQFGKGRAPAAPQGDTSKAAMVKFVTDTFDWSIATVGQLSEADFTKTFGAGKGPGMTGLELLYQTMIHTAHTRGYAEMFLRNKGVVPPTYAV
jgi:uncharacterized damage-inducible protein DinB